MGRTARRRPTGAFPSPDRWAQCLREGSSLRAVTLAFLGVLAYGGSVSCIGPAPAARARMETKERAMKGIETVTSAFGPKETMARLEAAVRGKGLTVFAR